MRKTRRDALLTRILLVSLGIIVLIVPVAASGKDRVLTIELQGVDGGSAKGLLIPGAPSFLSTLTGDMNIRVANCAGLSFPQCNQEPGETLITTHLALIDANSRPDNGVFQGSGYGECFIAPSNFATFEGKFASEGLDLDGSSILGWGGILVRLVSDQPASTDVPQSVACLLLFKEDAGGVAFAVADPTEASGFILSGNISGNTPDGGGTESFKRINMIGDVAFSKLH